MIETDYLVVGAGAAGMAFTDALLAHSDATVTIVDRRDAPGGHWVDAYPYVRLHQPSTFYGVDSVPLGQDAIDAIGTNAGFYELAGADELRAYYERVMHRHFLPTGRVRYFPSSDYVGEHRFVSRLTGASWQVRVRRKLVDTTYLAAPSSNTTSQAGRPSSKCLVERRRRFQHGGHVARICRRQRELELHGSSHGARFVGHGSSPGLPWSMLQQDPGKVADFSDQIMRLDMKPGAKSRSDMTGFRVSRRCRTAPGPRAARVRVAGPR